MLDNFVVQNRINLTFEFGGLDTLEYCLNKKHFLDYPHTVDYKYNSRGFRDSEWPDDLSNCVWALGDSFTVGIGAPVEHNWCSVLGKHINNRVINCSQDGASNDWIRDRAVELINELSPSNIIIQWTYVHRRQINGEQVHFDKSSTDKDDINNLANNIKSVELIKGNTNIVHSTIPYKEITYPNILYQLIVKAVSMPIVFVPPIAQLDLARDYHHYDLLTSTEYAKQYALCLT